MRELGREVTEIRAIGGGAKSPLWRQIQADVFGADVLTLEIDEGPAFGAALLAMVGAGRLRQRGGGGRQDGAHQGSDPAVREPGRVREGVPVLPLALPRF